jgi:hypothetical protein
LVRFSAGLNAFLSAALALPFYAVAIGFLSMPGNQDIAMAGFPRRPPKVKPTALRRKIEPG